MINPTLESLAANARDALGGTGELHSDIPEELPRYELFGSANSICSQKVRVVLAHHGLPYVNQAVNLFLGQTYLPEYVRLRMKGCEQFGGALASHHGGSTSASGGGCDGVVVPTLIDWQSGDVIVDSKRICLHLDSQVAAADKLYPDDLAAAIDEDLAVVDNMPNYQMLMDRDLGASETDATRDSFGGNFSQKKVAWCDRYLEEHADDPVLVAAYTAKRAKELSAANALFSPEAMQAAYGRARTALIALERKLERRDGAWLYGDDATMADLFWGVELLRMKNIGVATFWEGGRLPQVERFSATIEALGSIRTAIIEWPGAMF